MTGDAELRFGGIPTDMEIRQIREAYPDDSLTEGMIIPYDAIAKILKKQRTDHRYRTVTSRWRRLVEHDSQKIIGTEKGIGFKVLVDKEKVDLSGAKLRSAVKCVRRSHRVAAQVDPQQLDAEARARYDQICKRHAKLMAAAQVRENSKKNLPAITDERPNNGQSGR